MGQNLRHKNHYKKSEKNLKKSKKKCQIFASMTEEFPMVQSEFIFLRMHLLGQKRVIFACFFVCYYASRRDAMYLRIILAQFLQVSINR
jgi:hypothetical protein